MNKPKVEVAPKKAPRKPRPQATNMDRFYGRMANMHPYIAAKKLAKLTKHERKNWNGK